MLIGYANAPNDDQETATREFALKQARCKKIFSEIASGGQRDRPQLMRALDQLRAGDVLVLGKLDRLSRLLKNLLKIMERIDRLSASFHSLAKAIETATPAGRMMMQMIGSFGEFERSMIRERTRAGLESARKQGHIGGRKPKLDAYQQQEIVAMVIPGQKTTAETARLFNIHPATASRLLDSQPQHVKG
ncbi:MAG: recombinase family protein [Glaciimonas sp.]|nr:recombinase family protein [Glaciimonas sp.]